MRTTLMLTLLGIFVSGLFEANGSESGSRATENSVSSDAQNARMSAHKAADEIGERMREEAKAARDRIVQSLGDTVIYTKIESRLLADSTTPALKINVDVFRDVVTLRGEVKTPVAKEEAEHIAATTGGVREVHNLLTIAA